MTETQAPAERFAVGTVLPPTSFPITRKDLVRYAGSSGDFNDIHWNGRFAVDAGQTQLAALDHSPVVISQHR